MGLNSSTDVIDKRKIFTLAGIQNPDRPVRSVAMVCLNALSSKVMQGSHLNFNGKEEIN